MEYVNFDDDNFCQNVSQEFQKDLGHVYSR